MRLLLPFFAASAALFAQGNADWHREFPAFKIAGIHRLDEVLLVYLGNGDPAASVGGFTPEGLPVGVQIVGRNQEDGSVIQMA